MSIIKFGTDGWRAVIAEDFTFANCRIVAQGIAGYVNTLNLNKKGIVIGYDNRFMSEQFACECAKVLVGNGIKVLLMRKAAPTPVTAFAIRLHDAGGAIMITASHNPPEYNGIKFIPQYAGPALPDVTEAIEEEIAHVINNAKTYRLELTEAEQLGLFEEIDIDREYAQHLRKLIKTEYFEDKELKIIVNPMFGAGIGYLSNLLTDLGCEVKTINNYRDVLFGGTMPEPTEAMLSDLKRAVISYSADIGLAMDGDADRFGIIDREGIYISANNFMYLLLDHLLKTRNFRGPVARSLATTNMLDRVAQRNGLNVIETPVGFKYIGEALREKGCILGGEESGGLSIWGHIPEKDGILAGLLAAELVAYSGQSISELLQGLQSEYGKAVNARFDINVKEEDKAQIMARLREYRPKVIAGEKVETVNEQDGLKVIMEDNSWFLIRASGTENLFRIYVETYDEEKLEAIKEEILERLSLNYV